MEFFTIHKILVNLICIVLIILTQILKKQSAEINELKEEVSYLLDLFRRK